jgi:hypothetical protein
VVDPEGRTAGHIQEIVARRGQGAPTVVEYRLGVYAIVERLGGRAPIRWVLRWLSLARPTIYRVPWQDLELSDPERPRLRCARGDLREEAPRRSRAHPLHLAGSALSNKTPSKEHTMPEKAARTNEEQLHELLYQALQTEMGGIEVYRTALRCAVNEDLQEEWQEYLEQTEHHVEVVRGVFEKIGLDPDVETPGRNVIKHIGESLVKAMEMALERGDSATAELVAAECVVHAETKDHLNWELIGMLAKKASRETASALKAAHEEVEEEEDEHLYHTTGWTRELWVQSLGMPAVLPPPEEEKDVKTAIGAARAKMARTRMKKAS